MKALLTLALLLLPSVAFAQGPNIKNPYRLTFCWTQMESDGTTPAVGPFQALVTIDTTDRPLVALPAPSGAPGTGGCPAGSFPYLLTGYNSTKGPHAVKVAIVSPDGTGDASVPFAFKIVGNPPLAPTAVQAIQ
jgi:hypothetical protein